MMVLRCFITPTSKYNRLSRRFYSTPLLYRHDGAANRRYQWQSILTSFNYQYNHTAIIQRPVTSLLFGRAKKERPWHDPKFMNDSTPEQVEQWLLSLLKTARMNADNKGIITNYNNNNNSHNNAIVYFDKSFNIDATAYLRVMEAYTRSKMSSSPQKMEYWLGMNERHYATAVDVFYEKFGDQSSQSDQKQYDQAAAVVKSLQPTVEHYNSLIEAWGQDKDLHSVVRSNRWLKKLEDDANGNDYTYTIIRSPLYPNARSYDLYLHSCSRGLGKKENIHIERAKKCEDILHYMLASDTPIWPTTESFNYVLRAYTRCRKVRVCLCRVLSVFNMKS